LAAILYRLQFQTLPIGRCGPIPPVLPCFVQPSRIVAVELRSVAFGRMTLHSIDRNGRRRKEITSGSAFHFRTHAIDRQERLIDFSTANGHNRLHVYP
jgi:hypothetical protein